MAAEASKSSSSADSYIGSVISLTSKSEIRYEGILYSINAEESSIGLRNVRSFGSEGRKKDGPQIPPSDRVYEFILFRGTDIKDLQVKSAPPAQATSMTDTDPAIIQSHYPPPPTTSTTFSTAASVSPTDVNFHTPQMGHPGSNFPGGMPLYHHAANLGSWGPAPPPVNGNSLPVPIYWSGMYGLPNGLPHLHQQTFLQPHPGLSVPPTMQQPMPYSSMSAPPQAAAPNVASSSSTLPATSSSSANTGFNPPPLAVAMNGPTSSSPLIAATSSSTALTSSSFPSSSLLVVPSLQQSILYSGFSAPAPAAFIKGPSSSTMPYTTNSSSAILGYNPPPPSLAMNVPTSGAIKMPSSSSMPFTTNSSSAILGYSPPQPALVMNVQTSGSPFLPCSSSSTPLTSSSLPSLSLPVLPSLTAASQTNSSSVFDKGLNSVHSSEAKHVGLPTFAALTVSDSETIRVNPPSSTKVNNVSGSTILPYKNSSQADPSVLSSSTPSQKEVPIPSLVTPGQLLQSKKSETSSQSSQVAHKDVKVIQVSSSTEQSVLVPKEKEAQLPILPLPPAPRPYHKPNGSPQVRHNYRGSGRGRGRGRGIGGSRPVTRFMEDFDFSAMNERFNKDEVWDHLGKSNKIHSNDKEGDEIDEDANEDDDDAELPKIAVKPVYNKDDFFDTLSSNVRDNESQNARPRFSEQLKLDTETFGEFARHRGGRGPGRGGRGSNYGRGSSYGRSGTSGTGRGYGRAGRGRERALLSQAS